jgi:hypothetical protein
LLYLKVSGQEWNFGAVFFACKKCKHTRSLWYGTKPRNEKEKEAPAPQEQPKRKRPPEVEEEIKRLSALYLGKGLSAEDQQRLFALLNSN